jgi:predicted ABC-type ATPase
MGADAPTVIVLGGPNGAGKTTASRTLLAETLNLLTFVNADVIAQGLAAFNPESVAMEAGRIMLQRLEDLAQQRADFAFESTLSGRSYARWLASLGQAGYQIQLVYFWLASADLAVARVAERVRMGGHNIPEDTIRRRYRASIGNLFRLYFPLAHSWKVYDNSQPDEPELIAAVEQNGRERILNESVWSAMRKQGFL